MRRWGSKIGPHNAKTTWHNEVQLFKVIIKQNQKSSLEKLIWKIVYVAKNQLKRMMHNTIKRHML